MTLRFVLVLFVLSALFSACTAEPTAETPNTAAPSGATDQAHEAGPAPAKLPQLAAVPLTNGEKLQVVATTNIVADVVGEVAGDRVDLYAMLPIGADPHSYQPTPQDLRALNDADVIFVNGLGLEETMALALDDFVAKTVVVNTGIEAVEFGADLEDDADADHAHEGVDPHSWFSIHAVEVWTHNIAHVLSDLDPANAEEYAAAAEAYAAELEALHDELTALVDDIPVERRKFVTDHDSLGYLAAEYNFEIVGAVIPSFSTLAEPSARQLAALQDLIQSTGVQAIFIGTTTRPNQEAQLAEDLGIRIVPIYTGSLSAADGPAATYIDFMRYNLHAIVEALRESD